jgi:acetolactate synthase-1/2/3 large subunit
MTGARFLAETLAGYGVTHTFMVPAVLRRTMAEMERRTEILNIHTHGEKSAAYMADGFARASGRPGICMAQQVGSLNLAAGIRDAWLAHSPIIAFTGGGKPTQKYRKLYQEANDLPAFEPYTKWNAAVEDVSRFPDMVRQAFRAATSGCPGPVHLQFQGQEGEIDQVEGDLEVHIDEAFSAVPPFRPLPDPRSVRAAVERIVTSERPVLIAGGGVRASGAGETLRAFAETANVPVATSLNGRDSIPDFHPLSVGVVGTYSRASANRTVHEADLAIFIGTETGSLTTNFWRLPTPGTPAIQIDIDAESLGRNYPLEIAVLGDAKVTLEQLLAQLGDATPERRLPWIERIEAIEAEWQEEFAPALGSDAIPIRPERICSDLTRLLPEDTIVVVDTGHAGMWMGGLFDLTSCHQSYIRSAGHLGWAFPAGLGAKCACPDRPVFTFTGDLGFWYHIAEIETAVRWNIKAVTLVNNNHSGNQSMRGFSLAYEGEPTDRSRELWVHKEVNFAQIAEDIGAFGIRVERPQDLENAVAKAFEADRPAVIDVVTDIEAIAPIAWDPSGWVQRY